MNAPLTLPYVEADLHYADPSQGAHKLNNANMAKSTHTHDVHHVRIHDMRPVKDGLALDRNGFALLSEPTKVRDFTDEKEVEAVYFPEVEAMMKRLTGADRVLLYGPIRRSGDPARGEGVSPVTRPIPHIDHNEPTVRHFVTTLVPEAEAEELLERKRFMLVNVWRPITPVERDPLALCDASTITRADLFPAKIYGGIGSDPNDPEKFVAEGWSVTWNDNHRWYYVPEMQPGEALAFRLMDTDLSMPQFTAHAAFADPSARADAPARQSFEIRTICFLPD